METMKKILVIDDDSALLKLVDLSLREHGYEVVIADNGATGLRQAFNLRPDIVLLDVMMPTMDGWDTLARLRAMSDLPIIMLTGKDGAQDVVRGLDLGADDYVIKPFDISELAARISAILRRTESASSVSVSPYSDAYLSIDYARRRVMIEGQPVSLTPKEFRLLLCLVRRAGRVVPHQVLLSEVWGPEYSDETQYLKLYIRYLREKIERDPSNPEYILTAWGEGYYFRDPPK
jgi:two-component system KDP operon response regulator KdpE